MGRVVELKKCFKDKQDRAALPRHNVNFIIFSEQGEVIVFERFCKKSLLKSGQDNPNHPDVEKWHDIPGGRVDYPEDHIEAIGRENIEELGIRVKEILHLTTMENPTPGCAPGSTRSIYVVIGFNGVPLNKAGVSEGHLCLKTLPPSEAAVLLENRIDDETRDFLNVMAPDFFRIFCRKNQTELVRNNTPSEAVPLPR